jgi:DNA-binding response OmpR family regulator
MQALPTILVVEDDQLIQSVVEESLTEGGFKIEVASSAAQAVALLDEAGGKYRALVTDINLGRDLPHRLRARASQPGGSERYHHDPDCDGRRFRR